MEASIIDLLKDAVYEENIDIRLLKISKACKRIAEILPFEKKRIIILEESELPKFLLLTLPLFGRSIKLLLQEMLKTFKENESFILNFWKGLEYISEIRDNTQEEEEKKQSNLFSLNSKEDLKINNAFLRMDYCRDLLRNKFYLKEKTLFYLNELLVLIKEYHYDLIKTKIRVLKFFERFLTNTFFEKTIIRCCELITSLKKKWIQIFHHDFSFDSKIEAILISKQMVNTRPIKRNSTVNFNIDQSETNSPMLKDFNIKEGLKNSEQEIKIMKVERKSIEIDASQNRFESISQSSFCSDEENYDEKFAENDEDRKNLLVIQIENWLCNEDSKSNLIGKCNFMSEFFKLHDNFKIFITLILDPTFFLCSNCWIKKYPNITKEGNEFKNLFKDNCELRKRNPDRFPRYFNIYHLRSYKTLQILTNATNFSYIYNCNNSITEIYFACLYHVLLKDETLLNPNHLAKLTEYFLKREPDISLNLIFNYNLLFKFIQMISFPLMKSFLTSIIGNFHKISFLSMRCQLRTWRYLLLSGLLPEISKLLLYGNIDNLNIEKTTEFYKTPELEFLINNFEQISEEEELNQLRKERQLDYSPLIEITFGFKTDIDRIKQNIDAIKNLQRKSYGKIIIRKVKKIATMLDSNPNSLEGNEYLIDFFNKELNMIGERVNNQRKLTRLPTRISDFIKIPASIREQISDSPLERERSNSKSPKQMSPKKSPTMNSSLKLPNIKTISIEKSRNQTSTTKHTTNFDNKEGSLNNLEIEKGNKMSIIKRISNEMPSSKVNGYLDIVSNDIPKIKKKKWLYPLNPNFMDQCIIDKLIKMDCFRKKDIIKNEDLISLDCAEFISLIIKNIIEYSDFPMMKKIIDFPNKDYTVLFISIFMPDNSVVFENILINYLIKIKICQERLVNSAFICGETVNLILSHLNTLNLRQFSDNIYKIYKTHFSFFCNTIISSYNWITDTSEIKIQNIIIDDLLIGSRLLLVNTFYLMLKNDKYRGFELIKDISETFWHVLIIWFFDKKHNNMYQNLFVNLMELCFKYGSEQFYITILIKLNLIGFIFECLEDVFSNEVLFVKIPVESLFYFVRKLVKIIENNLKVKSSFKNINIHMKTLCTWNSVLKITKKNNNQNTKVIINNSMQNLLYTNKKKDSSPLISHFMEKNKKKQVDAKKNSELQELHRTLSKEILAERKKSYKFLKRGSGESNLINKSTFSQLEVKNDDKKKQINETLPSIDDYEMGYLLKTPIFEKKIKASHTNLKLV